MELIIENPVSAMRCFFHHPNGDTNTEQAAQFFNVKPETIEHWEREQTLPLWAMVKLDIQTTDTKKPVH